jgi:hypothetical protein
MMNRKERQTLIGRLEERLVEAEVKEGIRTCVCLMISVFVKTKKEKRKTHRKSCVHSKTCYESLMRMMYVSLSPRRFKLDKTLGPSTMNLERNWSYYLVDS